jgi:integrase
LANGSVVQYQSKRGVVYRLKYRDAAGKQIQETLGSALEGWSKRKAEQELRNRLADVDRELFVRPEPIRFADFARRFLEEYLPGRNLKYSTTRSYDQIINGHLIPFFGHLELLTIEHKPELIDAYISEKNKAGLSSKTIRNHLTTLSTLFKRAVVWKLIRTNPVLLIEKPRTEDTEMNVLTEDEIANLRKALEELHSNAPAEEQGWWSLARVIVLVALGTGLRRGELLGLRWEAVDLERGLLHVRAALVRGRLTSPKSRTSRRTIELGPLTLDFLKEYKAGSAFAADDDHVFAHPELGVPVDPSKLSRMCLRPALKRAEITKPFRPFHDLRHTAVTHEAAAGNPSAYIQMKAGHSSGAITERYIHASQVLFPGAAARSESRIFGGEMVASTDASSTRVDGDG